MLHILPRGIQHSHRLQGLVRPSSAMRFLFEFSSWLAQKKCLCHGVTGEDAAYSSHSPVPKLEDVGIRNELNAWHNFTREILRFHSFLNINRYRFVQQPLDGFVDVMPPGSTPVDFQRFKVWQ